MKFYSRPNELLKDHNSKVIYEFNKMNINVIIIIKECIEDNIDLDIIVNILNNVPVYHDYGKMSPYFQDYLKGKYKKEDKIKSHSEASCIKYINDMFEIYVKNLKMDNKRKEIKAKRFICKFIISCAYNILKHHGNLSNILDDDLFLENEIKYYQNNKKVFEFIDIDIENLRYIKTLDTKSVSFKNPFASYLLFKLNYAMLIKADYLAVYKFMHEKDLEDNKLTHCINVLKNNFNNNKLIDNIYKYELIEIELSEINSYRAKMFLESADNLLNNINEYIYYLEAPTGSGKSTIAVNLALNLVNDTFSRIIYVSPLNNISEQMYEGTNKLLSPENSDTVALINNRESIITTGEYSKDYLNYQTFNYPIVMTSHVKFFNILFGTNRKDLLALESFRNSIIILDEIQNYKNKLWIKFINSITQISKFYNIKFVIMSATLPKMDKLIQNENKIETVNLIENTDYYFKFFRKRVEYDYSLLNKLMKNEKNNQEEVLNKIDEVIASTNKHRILIETLSTKSCEEFYNYLKKYKQQGFKVYKMLSITNRITRQYIIDEIQARNEDNTYKNKKIILIGTQCIEAGIDIDMNVGFKDISILDFDEQFIGRLERNFYDVGKCYFYDLDNEDYIYKDDYRIEFNLKTSKEYRKLFENKEFSTYYKDNYNWLNKKEIDNYEKFKNKLNRLQYKDIEIEMQLIDSNTYNFLMLGEYEDDKSTLDSKEIFNEYINLKQSHMEYSEKQIKLKDIKKKLSTFIYSINTYNFKEEPKYEKQEGFYLVNDSVKYFDNTYENKLIKNSNLNLQYFKSSIDLFI